MPTFFPGMIYLLSIICNMYVQFPSLYSYLYVSVDRGRRKTHWYFIWPSDAMEWSMCDWIRQTNLSPILCIWLNFVVFYHMLCLIKKKKIFGFSWKLKKFNPKRNLRRSLACVYCHEKGENCQPYVTGSRRIKSYEGKFKSNCIIKFRKSFFKCQTTIVCSQTRH